MRSPIVRGARPLVLLLALAGLFHLAVPRATAARPAAARAVRFAGARPAGEIPDSLQTEAGGREGARVAESYGKLPLQFEANRGQTDSRVRFLARGDGYNLFLTPREAVFSLLSPEGRRDVLRMSLVGSKRSPKISGEGELGGKSNYYSGSDRRRWVRDVPSYARVRYEKVYPGVDVVYYGRQRELEYDFHLAPGADPASITLAFEGADALRLDAEGDLVLQVGGRSLTHTAPVVYQDDGGARRPVEGSYVLKGEGRVGFRVGEYDPRLPLVIDPVAKIGFSTFHGGEGDDNAFSVAVSAAGSAVVAGTTLSTDYPSSNGDPDENFGNRQDAFITKFNPDGTGTLYSVYLGGWRADAAIAVALDPAENAYVTGTTNSFDFPTTPGVVDERRNRSIARGSTFFGDDVFVTKLDTGGAIVYSTFLGGDDDDDGAGIAVDAAGRAYVTGETGSARFPVKNEFQNDLLFGASTDVFLTVFNSEATGLIYSSYLGGKTFDTATSVAIDSDGNAYVTGATDSVDSFPVKGPSGPFQAQHAGRDDLFVAKFNPFAAGEASLVYSTLVGGGGTDHGLAVAVDGAGRAHVTGVTGSFDFPLFAAEGAEVLDRENVINEAFILAVNADGSRLDFSTLFGGDGQDTGRGIRLDAAGNIYVAGNTTSVNGFPLKNAFQSVIGGGVANSDAFVAKLAPDARKVLYSSYLGGKESDVGFALDIDARGNAYVAGDAVSDDFPTTDGVAQRERAGSGDTFLTKIGELNPDTVGVFNPSALQFQLRNENAAGAPDITVDFGEAGDLPVAGDWDSDGVTDVGVFRPAAGQFFLLVGGQTITVTFGQAGDLPVAGDWDGDGEDSVGVFRPSKGQFFLTNTNALQTTIDFNFQFGANGDLPIAGDWDADGLDEVGVFTPAAGLFSLTNSNESPNIDITVAFGVKGDRPVAGDWDGDGVDSVGVFSPSVAQFFLTNTNAEATTIDFNFQFGAAGDLPVAGDWDGTP